MIVGDPTITLSPFALTAATILASVAASWGVMQTTLKQLTKEIERVRHDVKNMQQAQQGAIMETLERVARIEGKLGV